MPLPYSLHAGSATVCSCVVQLICDCYREVEGGGDLGKSGKLKATATLTCFLVSSLCLRHYNVTNDANGQGKSV